jgi:acylphosphatase
MERELRLHVTGRVQGVGFRAYVQRHAVALLLTGVARNLPDGAVEVIAQGTEPSLRRLLGLVRNGPRLAHVDAVAELWCDPERKYPSFTSR